MIRFIDAGTAKPSEIVGKFVFGSLPMTRYQTIFVGAPSLVLEADNRMLRGHPIDVSKVSANGPVRVVRTEIHDRDLQSLRIICDTEAEVGALIATRDKVLEIKTKNEGYLPDAEIGKMILAVYADVVRKAAEHRLPQPKEVQPETSAITIDDMMEDETDEIITEEAIHAEFSKPAFMAQRPAQQRGVFGRRMG